MAAEEADRIDPQDTCGRAPAEHLLVQRLHEAFEFASRRNYRINRWQIPPETYLVAAKASIGPHGRRLVEIGMESAEGRIFGIPVSRCSQASPMTLECVDERRTTGAPHAVDLIIDLEGQPGAPVISVMEAGPSRGPLDP